MKKVLLLATVVVAFASCKKEYTCTCTTTSTIYMNGVATTGAPQTDDVKTDKMSKKDAEKKCESMNGNISAGDTQFGSKAEITCKLK
jgi:hypothetical protein